MMDPKAVKPENSFPHDPETRDSHSLADEPLPKCLHDATLEIQSLSPLADLKDISAIIKRANTLFIHQRDLLQVQALMPGRVVGPDADIFDGRDLGEIPPLPHNIQEVLRSRCPLANNGKIVAQTHRLVLVPAAIDGEPLTLIKLRQFSEEVNQKQGTGVSIFHGESWYENQLFANSPLDKSRWVLEYKEVTMSVKGPNESSFDEVLLPTKTHRTAKVLEHVATLALQYLENKERLYPFYIGVCDDKSDSSDWVRAGFFSGDGLGIDQFNDGGTSHFGRAVVWNFQS